MLQKMAKTEIVPFGYQKEALACIENAENRGALCALVIMASGLGKTILAALFLKRRLTHKNTLRCMFLCHQNHILEQAQNRFKNVLGYEHDYGFYHGEEKTKDAQLLFASFQTMAVNLDEFDPKDFDIIIVDETHHAFAETYKPVIDYFEPEFLLGITATPDRGDEQDIKEIYGEPVYELNLGEALARGLLCPVEYKLMTDEIYFLENLATQHGKLSINKLNRLLFIPKRDEEIAKVIHQEMEKVQNPRVMIFCSSIEHAEQMGEIINGAVPIHSKVGSVEKRLRIELFRQGAFSAGVTVDMFNEAFDVPETNIIIFLRTTKSKTIYFQQLGRGLRPHPSKSKVVILDFVGNCERISSIYNLWKEVEEKRESFAEKIPNSFEKGVRVNPFVLNMDASDFQEKVIPIIELMESLERDFYPTWQEASLAAVNLKLMTVRDYQKGYKEDPRLPSNPQQVYSNFPKWEIFLGKEEYYPTWQEASVSVIKLGIKDLKEYVLKKKYKEDSKLPPNPKKFYTDYPGGEVFFRKKYVLLSEASEAAIKLGIQTIVEYRKRYKEDFLLPRYPEQRYPEFPGYVIFLGKESAHSHLNNFYETWQEASDAVINLGITNMREYAKRRFEDPRLPSKPIEIYSDYPGGILFLQRKYRIWQEAAVATKALGIKTQEEYFKKYLLDEKLPSQPSKFYSDFPGYPIFLRDEVVNAKYATWEEAATAAKALGIKDHLDYKKRYTEDPALPGNPAAKYDDFPGLAKFFDVHSKFDKYQTWEEASKVASTFGFDSKISYKKSYKSDPKLPRHPERYYSDFPGWPKFLGKS